VPVPVPVPVVYVACACAYSNGKATPLQRGYFITIKLNYY